MSKSLDKSEYTAYTAKTHGTELIASSRAEHESVFIAESNLTEIESIISNERNKGETRLMTPKSSLLVNSWFHLCQLLINSSKLEEGTRDDCHFSLKFELILMEHVD